jgi:hypothetical protein
MEKGFQIRAVEVAKNRAVFDVGNMPPQFAIALRAAMMDAIPTLTIEIVTMGINNTVLDDKQVC